MTGNGPTMTEAQAAAYLERHPLVWCDCWKKIREGGMCACGGFGIPEPLNPKCSMDRATIAAYAYDQFD